MWWCVTCSENTAFFDLQDGHYEYLYYCDARGVAFTAEKIRVRNQSLYLQKQERNMLEIKRSLQKAHDSHYCWKTSQNNRWIPQSVR